MKKRWRSLCSFIQEKDTIFEHIVKEANETKEFIAKCIHVHHHFSDVLLVPTDSLSERIKAIKTLKRINIKVTKL